MNFLNVSILISIFFGALLVFLINSKVITFSIKSNLEQIRNASSSPLKRDSYILLISFLLFLVLPLFWGLSFFLVSDGNVLVVIFTIAWIYNWLKYTFFLEE
jgi:hypothetical protein